MSEKETEKEPEPEENPLHKRLIRLPMALWDALDRDAIECRRSSQKQLEAILTTYYALARVDLGDLAGVREIVSPSLAKSGEGSKDQRTGTAFLERVIREMDEEEGSKDSQKGKRKTGNG